MRLFFLTALITVSVTLSSFSQTGLLKKSIKRGNEIYTDFCVSCHLPNGEGVKTVYPPLANSDFLKKNRKASIRGLKYGLKGEITVNKKRYNSYMPPLGLSNDEIADVMNYITNSWGNKNDKIVTEKEVSQIKKSVTPM